MAVIAIARTNRVDFLRKSDWPRSCHRCPHDGIQEGVATLTNEIIACAIAVHDQLDPGFLEAVYQQCFALEMKARGLQFEDNRKVPLVYRGVRISASYRFDFVIEKSVLVEVKSVDLLAPIHRAQAINYLKLTGLSVALLINFNVPVLKQGVRRLVHPQFYGKDSDLFIP